MNDSEEYFTEEVISYLLEKIRTYQGQEILFGGCVDTKISSKKISKCEIISRGNSEQVPILPSQITRYQVLIHNHPSSYLKPSEEDLEIATTYADEVGFMIIDNEVKEVNIVIPIHSHISDKQVVIEEILKYFKSDGILSQVVPEFESRNSQAIMVTRVAEAFNQENILLCEAETGTGKSLAYGIVSSYWTLLNKKKVVISTNTINLQEQLISKDLPIIKKCLKKMIGTIPKIMLVKGKNNYLCLKKFEDFKKEFTDTLNLSPKEKINLHEINELLEWGQETLTGDKNELTFIPNYELWDRLGCENDTCQRKRCKFESHCFQYKLKKNIANADILIVNHHILCADLAIKKETGFYSTTSLLSPYERLIVDESHHLEDIATIYFGSQASNFEIKRTLGLIARIDYKKNVLQGGLLKRIIKELSPKYLIEEEEFNIKKFSSTPSLESGEKNGENFLQKFYSLLNTFIKERIVYEDKSPSYYEQIFSYFDQYQQKSRNTHSDVFFTFEKEIPVRKEYKYRFQKEEFSEERWQQNYRLPLEEVLKQIQILINLLLDLYKLLMRKFCNQGGDEKNLPTYLIELQAYRERLLSYHQNFLASTEFSEKDEVRWIRTVRTKNNVYFACLISPLEVGHILREYLFTPLKTVVLTSATLSSGRNEDSFHHIKERLGIDDFDSKKLVQTQLLNEFDYANNCKIILPPVLPPVTDRQFTPIIANHLKELLNILRGRMLWLFTSYTMMKTIHTLVKGEAMELGVELWIQGDEPRHELISKIKSNKNGVLLGVSSFWEGVDIKGENLSCLVMIKLPFAAPDDPVWQARLERIEALGKNPFMDYSLPQAILRFKQGFGRLIRSANDRGIFILFDNRIFTKGYGRAFIKTLPQGITPQRLSFSAELFNSFLRPNNTLQI